MKKLILLCFIFITSQQNLLSQNFEWAISAGGTPSPMAPNDTDKGFSTVSDALGNTYTTGIFSGVVDFDPSSNTVNLTSNNASGDVFIMKLNSTGNLVWAKNFGGNGYDEGLDITIDPTGNIITTGRFSGTVDFDPSSNGVTSLTSNGSYDIFIQKLDSSGNFIWAKSIGSDLPDDAGAVATDHLGNIYTCGSFRDTIDLNPNASTMYSYSAGNSDIFIQKLDPSGNFIWAKSIGGTSNEHTYGMEINNSNDIYITGFFEGSIDFNPNAGINNSTSNGSSDIFILKLDENGSFIWNKTMGGPSTDEGKDITLDNLGNVYTTGYYNWTVDFDPNAGVNNLSSVVNTKDIFIQKLDPSGNFIWAKGVGGSSQYDVGYSIATDNMNNIYLTGSFFNTVDFDPNTGVSNLTSNGLSDIFILKLDNSGSFIWAEHLGGNNNEIGYSISLDDLSNIYVTGFFKETVDFDPSIGTFNLSAQADDDLFIFKLSQSLTTPITNLESSKEGINIFPNPTNGIIYFDKSMTGLLQIYTLDGKEVWTKNIIDKNDLNLSALKNGVYILTITTDKERIKKKIIKS
ncbi:MAG: T9SS type A sorting domain-containing protein [Aureispira sp.]|nr:T9SS type A sorting domain-containing protein [Aureispira sp.]